MPKVLYAGLAILGLAVLSGCGGGGGGGGPAGTPGPANPLAGYYGGPGTVSTSSDPIFGRIGVATDSILCGSLIDRKASTRLLLGALVSASGDLSNGSYQALDANGRPIGTGMLSGTLTQTGTGSVSSIGAVLTVSTLSGTSTYTFANLTVPSRKATKKRSGS